MENAKVTILFDMEGVIVNTKELHMNTWNTALKKYDVKMTEELNNDYLYKKEDISGIVKALFALNNKTLTDDEVTQLYNSKDKAYTDFILSSLDESYVLPGIKNLMSGLKDEGFKVVVASTNKHAVRIIEKLGLTSYANVIVDPTTVTKDKPNPEVFLKGLEYVGNHSSDAIGIEDSPRGLRALRDAHISSIGVKWDNTADFLKDATVLVNSSANISLKLVHKLLELKKLTL